MLREIDYLQSKAEQQQQQQQEQQQEVAEGDPDQIVAGSRSGSEDSTTEVWKCWVSWLLLDKIFGRAVG